MSDRIHRQNSSSIIQLFKLLLNSLTKKNTKSGKQDFNYFLFLMKRHFSTVEQQHYQGNIKIRSNLECPELIRRMRKKFH